MLDLTGLPNDNRPTKPLDATPTRAETDPLTVIRRPLDVLKEISGNSLDEVVDNQCRQDILLSLKVDQFDPTAAAAINRLYGDKRTLRAASGLIEELAVIAQQRFADSLSLDWFGYVKFHEEIVTTQLLNIISQCPLLGDSLPPSLFKVLTWEKESLCKDPETNRYIIKSSPLVDCTAVLRSSVPLMSEVQLLELCNKVRELPQLLVPVTHSILEGCRLNQPRLKALELTVDGIRSASLDDAYTLMRSVWLESWDDDIGEKKWSMQLYNAFMESEHGKAPDLASYINADYSIHNVAARLFINSYEDNVEGALKLLESLHPTDRIVGLGMLFELAYDPIFEPLDDSLDPDLEDDDVVELDEDDENSTSEDYEPDVMAWLGLAPDIMPCALTEYLPELGTWPRINSIAHESAERWSQITTRVTEVVRTDSDPYVKDAARLFLEFVAKFEDPSLRPQVIDTESEDLTKDEKESVFSWLWKVTLGRIQ